MKNLKAVTIAFVAGALFTISTQSFAAESFSKISAILRPDYTVKVDGKNVKLGNAPIAYNGTTYVPLREAGKILGYNVGFKSGTITLDQTEKDVEPVEPITSETATETEWVSVSDLKIKGITVAKTDDASKLIISRGDKSLTIRLPEEGEVGLYQGGISVTVKDGEVFFNSFTLESF
ncbi:stalk domain-containing protein [Cohnella herbarum]|uniref:Copper amine oxidase-like N-terminal domain-containing protein n=1 Tax=Cohnella herbarum TaxID=2728023 RepID=A0A7Z2VF08_9BACL|nr:stalk domain-containing protein [Cohnella herbarum]QJD81730.1 hypothetical protein HH215_00045 [Cohnella herbarum]